MELKVKTNTLAWVEHALREAGELETSELFGHDEDAWNGAAIDSRADCSGRLFFALKGERTDGHRFVGKAADGGSPCVIVQTEKAAATLAKRRTPYLRVRNTLRALQESSRAYRGSLTMRVVAITGSAGKTTTKENVRAILRRRYRVHSNPGNYNNHIGVPLTLLDMSADTEYLVCEIGANHAGEIDFLSRLVRPDIAVITNIGDAHIGLFGSRDKIAEAKSEVLTGIDDQGHAVLPEDDDYIEFLRSRCSCKVVTFGYKANSSFRLSGVHSMGDRIDFHINGRPFSVPGFATFGALNACAAYAVGELCGVEADLAHEALAEFVPMEGRTKVHELRDVVLIDDSYNANPTSMRAAIDALCKRSAKRRVAVLGDMAELGVFAATCHHDLGETIGRSDVDVLVWVGEYHADVSSGLAEAGGDTKFIAVADADEAIARVDALLAAGDVVLVKASRSVGLDRVVDAVHRTRGSDS